MANTYTTMSKPAIEYLCGLIKQVVTLPTDVINNINLADNLTFSNIKIKELIDQCLIDANTEAQKIVGALTHLTCEETNVQPTLGNSQVNVIYLYSATGTAPYQQYLKISDTKLIDLGSTSISLADYLTATEIASTYAKQVDLNTLTNEVNAIKDTIGTETLTTTSQTITGSINELAGKSQIVTLTKSEYEALATKDPETYYVISDDSDSINVTNTINDSSTDNEIPTSKAVETRISKREIIKNVDLNTFVSEGKYYIQNGCTNSPVDGGYLDVMRYSDDFVCQICIRYHASTSENMYIRTKVSGTWQSWQKVCTTSVADVPKTTITFSDTTNYEVVSNSCVYYVSDGVCNMMLYVKCNTPATSWTGVSSVPKANGLHYYNSLPSSDGTDNLRFIIETGGALKFCKGTAGKSYLATFTYPVAES